MTDALSFLTCLIRAKNRAPHTLSVFFFPLAGLVLGFCLYLISVLGIRLLPGSLSQTTTAFLAAWFWLVGDCILTRGIHWDGLADIFDAGGAKDREHFWAILKDSRLGTFGALALFLVLLGKWLLVSILLAQRSYFLLIFAPAWSRLFPLWIGSRVPCHPSSYLGLYVANALNAHPSLTKCCAFLLLLIPLLLSIATFSLRFLLLLPFEYAILFIFIRMGTARGGISGDFLGAGICLSELAFFFSAL